MRTPVTPIRIVCLANSIKIGGRCIAGIELDNRNNPKIQSGHPKWIRPISRMGHGEVNIQLVSHISLLDVVELEVTDSPENLGCQSENIYFNEDSLRIGGTLDFNNLNNFCSRQSLIFGNRGKAVSEDVINDLTYSLMLIKTGQFEIILHDNKLRMTFVYEGNEYDLPITDPTFYTAHLKNRKLLKDVDFLYLCISLGVEHNGWHSKLIAGVIY